MGLIFNFFFLNRQPDQSVEVHSSAVVDSESTITWTSDKSNLAVFLRSDLATLSADDVFKIVPTFSGFSLSFVDLWENSAMVSIKCVQNININTSSLLRLDILQVLE